MKYSCKYCGMTIQHDKQNAEDYMSREEFEEHERRCEDITAYCYQKMF